MCGIVGHIDTNWSHEQSTNLLRSQMNRIKYRGPDADGVLVGDGFGLGHVRLSIIDPAGGNQPMCTHDAKLTVTFNGEIYNYIELRQKLQAKGYHFTTTSDTEVLLHGYREWKTELAEKLNGMFAFAIYNTESRELYLARDPYGQKPLYYTEINTVFHFASESKAFRDIPEFQGRIDTGAVAHYLAFEALYFDRSIFEKVRKLPPGHFLLRTGGTNIIQRFFTSRPTKNDLTFNDAVEQVDNAMREAVTLSYRADVPVGILLSGGLDSTLVLAYLREAYPSKSITSYTIQVDDPTYDESGYARMAAELFDTEHKEFPLTVADLATSATALPDDLDEPIADPGIMPMHYICKKVADFGKVALTGVGGDELFYGYISFKAEKLARLYSMIPDCLHTNVIKPIVEKLPNGKGYMRLDFLAKQFIKGFPAPRGLRNFQWTGSYDQRFLQNIFNPNTMRYADISSGLSYLSEIFDEPKEAGDLGRFAYQYQRTYLPDYVLPNSDHASMLNSVELRAPFLDPNLAHTVNAIPDHFKMKGLTTKYLMKKVAERYLPKELVHRKKIGFTVPVADMLRTSLREELCDVLSPGALTRQGLFNPKVVWGLLQKHLSGQANNYKPLWTMYVLQKWLTKEQKWT